jgi:hypothetical protein
MGRNTGNLDVITALQAALTSFLNDHRQYAMDDPEWVEGFVATSLEERASMLGCGCEDCILAGTLLGRI